MNQSGERRIVLSAPGFPVSKEDPDKPFLLNHAKALMDAGFKVIVVCPALPHLSGRHMVEGIEVIRVRYAPRRFQTLALTGAMYNEARGLKSLLVLPMLFAMIAATRRELGRGNSIAYGHWWIPGGLVSVIAAFLSRRSSVVHLHGSDADLVNNRFKRWLARSVLRGASVRLAVSADLARWGRRVSGRTVEVLPMPLNFELLPKPSAVPANGYLLAVGRLVPEKGFRVLIAAVALMNSDERPDLVIVGSGPDREKLSIEATRLDVKLRLAGAVSPRELADWYRRARVVVVPSLREGFGLVSAEAAAAGRAVIATNVGAAAEIISDGHSWLLVKPGDASALSDALRTVDPEWGQNGPRRISHLNSANHASFVSEIWFQLKH